MLTNGGLNFQRNGFIINPKTYKMIQHMRKYMRIVHTYMRNMRKYMRNICKYAELCGNIRNLCENTWNCVEICEIVSGRARGPGP